MDVPKDQAKGQHLRVSGFYRSTGDESPTGGARADGRPGDLGASDGFVDRPAGGTTSAASGCSCEAGGRGQERHGGWLFVALIALGLAFRRRNESMARLLCLVWLVGSALAVGCGRSPMDTMVRATGSGGSAASTGGAGGTATSGPCGDATCLTELFATCQPAGDCSFHGGSSPSAVFGMVCYANGVTMSYSGGDTGSGQKSELTVRRGGVLCYSIASSSPPAVSGSSYVIRDGNGTQVATAVTADKDGHVTVTCDGRLATTVDGACLVRIGDTSACTSGPCP